jgi:hypothetical protein
VAKKKSGEQNLNHNNFSSYEIRAHEYKPLKPLFFDVPLFMKLIIINKELRGSSPAAKNNPPT